MVDVVEVRGALQRWITETANARTHGTTHKRPAERFEVEREHLLDLPATRWEPALWREAKVHTDTHVRSSGRCTRCPGGSSAIACSSG